MKRTIIDAQQYAVAMDGRCLSIIFLGMKHNLLWKCNKCGYEWSASFDNVFYKKTWCRVCADQLARIRQRKIDADHLSVKDYRRLRQRVHRNQNRESLLKSRREYYARNPQKSTVAWGKWYQKNKIKRIHYMLMRRTNHKEKLNEIRRKWRNNNIDHCREITRIRYANDLQFKLKSLLRSRLRHAICQNRRAGSAVRDLGCSIVFLKSYLESKFLPGMTWENWSMRGWHIDHIMPLSSFDLSDLEQLKKACHYTNLRPLWAKDNLSKSNKLPQVTPSLL